MSVVLQRHGLQLIQLKRKLISLIHPVASLTPSLNPHTHIEREKTAKTAQFLALQYTSSSFSIIL